MSMAITYNEWLHHLQDGRERDGAVSFVPDIPVLGGGDDAAMPRARAVDWGHDRV